MTDSRDAEFADFVASREASLRRLANLLCQDWHRADDVVQAAITKLYVHWPRARAADSIDAYVRAIVVREFLEERRSSWIRRVTLTGQLPDRPAASTDPETALDMQAAIAALPPRQRATLVLRFYCDLPVERAAQVLGCTPGTVKSQTAKALTSLRIALGPDADAARVGTAPCGSPAVTRRGGHGEEGLGHA
ncbi:MAG TPA: SigE family RNA polymerase sigma factor [Streptosporangiaceae bacterium]|nr:SigE family RNA polymerase sigma factor [Streptosporangiaceae bacterium]